MLQVLHSPSKFTDIIEINKLELDSYTTLSLSAGVKTDRFSIEVWGENLSDERAQIAGNFVYDRAQFSTDRPLTAGLRVSFDY